MKSSLRIVGVIAAAMVVASCSAMKSDEDKELEPTKLVNFDTTLEVKRLWSTKIGDGAEYLRIALQPIGDGTRIYAASRDGNVVALQPDTGKEIWRTELDVVLSAGPGTGEGLVIVGGADGELFALDAATGNEMWRTNIEGETLARPAIKDDTVVAITIDNRLRAVSSFDGTQRWVVDQSTPSLTMRGSAAPVLVGTSVVAGFDNGRLISVDLASGDIEWEALLSPPSGRSDLERLSDVDGKISLVGQDLYAAGYQGRMSAIASESGQELWSREVSTFAGVAADWNNVYTVNEEGVVIAMTRRSGDEVWRQNSLIRREPTLPTAFHTTVVVGDMEGYLHFFNNFDGTPVARLRAGSSPISVNPVVVADRLYVQSDSGSVFAYVVQEVERARTAPDVADEGA